MIVYYFKGEKIMIKNNEQWKNWFFDICKYISMSFILGYVVVIGYLLMCNQIDEHYLYRLKIENESLNNIVLKDQVHYIVDVAPTFNEND